MSDRESGYTETTPAARCSNSPNIVLQAASASARVLNGLPVTMAAPLLEYSGRDLKGFRTA
jgi:hypothetical protein